MDVLIDRRFMESLFGDEEDERFADEYLLILSFAFDQDGTYIVDSFREERNARYGKIILLQFENINLSLKTLLQENLLY